MMILLCCRVPLLVEVWHRDKQLSKDVLLGVARLPLSDIIVAEKTKIMVSDKYFIAFPCNRLQADIHNQSIYFDLT